MSIRLVVTRGFGYGGTIPLVTVRGYGAVATRSPYFSEFSQPREYSDSSEYVEWMRSNQSNAQDSEDILYVLAIFASRL